MDNFRKKLIIKLIITGVIYIMSFYFINNVVCFFNLKIPLVVQVGFLGIIMLIVVVFLFGKNVDEINIAGVKIKESQKIADDIYTKYSEFKKSISSFIVFNLAVLEKDGSMDNITGYKEISKFLYSVKKMKLEMALHDTDIEKLQAVGKLKLFQSYDYELTTNFNIHNVMNLGVPEYVGGSYDISILEIDWKKLEDFQKDISSNKKDEYRYILNSMKKDYEEL